MRTVRVFSLSYSTDLLPGYGRGLSHSPNITSHVHNQSPIITPTGPIERTLFLGPNVGTSVTLPSFRGFGAATGKCLRPARATRQGEGSFGNATWLAGTNNGKHLFDNISAYFGNVLETAFVCSSCGVLPGKALRWLTWTMPFCFFLLFAILQKVHITARGKGGIVVLYLWYTKRIPTLHGGGSFCSPYERSDPIDMCISPRSPLGHSKPPHFCSETLALFRQVFPGKALPLAGRQASSFGNARPCRDEPFHSD